MLPNDDNSNNNNERLLSEIHNAPHRHFTDTENRKKSEIKEMSQDGF